MVSTMQIQKLMDDLPGLNVIIEEDIGDEFGAFSEWLEKASDEEIIAELKRWGLKKEDEPHIASVLPIVRRATEADEDFDDYLRRTGTKLTEDQDEAAAILGQFAWERTGCGRNTTENGQDSGEVDPTLQADTEATTSSRFRTLIPIFWRILLIDIQEESRKCYTAAAHEQLTAPRRQSIE